MYEPSDFPTEKSYLKAKLRKVISVSAYKLREETFKPWYRIDRFFRRCGICKRMAWTGSYLLRTRAGYGYQNTAFHLDCLLIPDEHCIFDVKQFVLAHLDKLYLNMVADEALKTEVLFATRCTPGSKRSAFFSTEGAQVQAKPFIRREFYGNARW